MSEDDKKKEFFIQEQIRKKPFYKRKEFQKIVQGLTLTMVFGASSGGVFAIVHPLALKYLKEPDKMVVESQETNAPETNTEAPHEKVIVEKELDLKEYERLYEQMAGVAEDTRKAIVTVTGITSELDLFNDVSESSSSAAGVVIGNSNDSMLILAESHTIEKAEDIKITFSDGSIADASLQALDEITDLAVLKVSFDELDISTKAIVQSAEFGKSGEVEIGDPIIAVGVDYISFGMVTSEPYLYICDGSYRKLNTDIIGKTENGGVLLNLEGQLVGILGPDSENSMTLNGVGISDIEYMVNTLANQKVMPYLGIVGREVTDALSEELSMPKGVIITRVEEESPAMKNGIQAADVISGMNGKTVESMQDYMKILDTLNPGDHLSVNLWRKGKEGYTETKVDITLAER